MYGYRKMYIGGKLVDSEGGSRHKVICPATNEVIGEVAWASKNDALRALEAAKAGFETWRKTALQERVAAMYRIRELVIAKEVELRECVMNEHGKTYEQAEEDWSTVVTSLQFYAEEIQRTRGELLTDITGGFEHKLVLEPLGVTVAFLAWNFPLLNLGFKLGPALASGCSIIIRPSQETPISAYMIGEICQEANLPAGVVNILTGPTNGVADTLSSSEIPSLLTLIGSTETGKAIMASGASSIKRYSMELGGNAPVIVYDDADINLAADIVSTLKFANTGQICVTPNRVYVARKIHDEFVQAVVERAKKVVMGHGRGSGATMGPLVSQRAQSRVAQWVKDSVASGATCVYGGSVPADKLPGFYFQPTVLTGVRDHMIVACDEVFGPVISIMPFDTEEEVLKRANDTVAGLASYVFSEDSGRIMRASRELRFGEVHVNGVRYNIDLPHGGIKQSGIGHDCSDLALHDYLSLKRVTTALRDSRT
jgi:succinate-semialdehyde dehydrogenase / glutarate-semialdehyde dehydrogenase